MKKIIAFLAVGLITIMTLNGLALAQGSVEKSAPPAGASPKAPEAAKPEAVAAGTKAADKEKAPKPVAVKRMGGLVVSVDAAVGKLKIDQESVKNHKVMELKVSKKNNAALADLKPGNAVNVWTSLDFHGTLNG